MRTRREFITLLGGAAAAWPLAARAQQPERMRRIGLLLPASATDPEFQVRVAAFVQGLQQAGWVIGRNAQLDYRWAGTIPRSRKHAAELIALAPDVILADGAGSVGALLQRHPHRADRIPGGRRSGRRGLCRAWRGRAATPPDFMNFEYSIGAKWLELLKQIAPGVTRVGGSSGPRHSHRHRSVRRHPGRGVLLRMDVVPVNVRAVSDIERDVGDLCAEPEWRADRDGERIRNRASQADHRTRRAP